MKSNLTVCRSTDRAMGYDVDWDVDRAMGASMDDTVRMAMYWAVSRAVNDDSTHPALADFLSCAGEEAP